jgi:hypothetical protein
VDDTTATSTTIMSEPPASWRDSTGSNDDFKPRASAAPTKKRSDPPSTQSIRQKSPPSAAPVAVVASTATAADPASVARAVARQQKQRIGLPTYKQQITGGSILKVEGRKVTNTTTSALSDSAVKATEEARKYQQEERTKVTGGTPTSKLEYSTQPSVNSVQTTTVQVSNTTSSRNEAAAVPKKRSPSTKSTPVKNDISPTPSRKVVAATEPAPTPPTPAKKTVANVHAARAAHVTSPPLHETWEFAAPPTQERGSCCVIS